jgi:FtsH-binding integral membrane protein
MRDKMFLTNSTNSREPGASARGVQGWFSMNKRAVIGLLSGTVLGVFCIFGVKSRMGDQVTGLFVFATWFNRLVMGMMIGFYSPISSKITQSALRGALLGLIVSFSLYVATDCIDLPGFIAGIFYGVIIDIICTKYGISKKNTTSESLR